MGDLGGSTLSKTLRMIGLQRRDVAARPLKTLFYAEKFRTLAPLSPNSTLHQCNRTSNSPHHPQPAAPHRLRSPLRPPPVFPLHAYSMGLFSTSPPPAPSHASPTPSPDGAFEAPDRQSRAHCWGARDEFFACLERNGIVDSIRDKDKADGACGVEGKGFERECAASWVRSFVLLGTGWRERKGRRWDRGGEGWRRWDGESGAVLEWDEWLIGRWGLQVTYFKQRRVMEHKKMQTLEQLAREGATELPIDQRKSPS